VADVEQLCERVILIDHGSIAYDGSLDALVNRISPFKVIRVCRSRDSAEDWSRYGSVLDDDNSIVSIQVVKDDALLVVRAILAANDDITDLSIAEPPIERVISQVYREGLA
jgi:ABC-2 type transport system ATP-binding protein